MDEEFEHRHNCIDYKLCGYFCTKNCDCRVMELYVWTFRSHSEGIFSEPGSEDWVDICCHVCVNSDHSKNTDCWNCLNLELTRNGFNHSLTIQKYRDLNSKYSSNVFKLLALRKSTCIALNKVITQEQNWCCCWSRVIQRKAEWRIIRSLIPIKNVVCSPIHWECNVVWKDSRSKR